MDEADAVDVVVVVLIDPMNAVDMTVTGIATVVTIVIATAIRDDVTRGIYQLYRS